jgi:hypothetical protein
MQLDGELREALNAICLNEPVIFAGTFDTGPGLRSALLELLEALPLPGSLPETFTARLDALEQLHAAALPGANLYHTRQAGVDDATLGDDLRAQQRHSRTKSLEKETTAALAEHLAELPSRWVGKAYKRKEAPLNPAQREEEENEKTRAWAREVLGLLLEAQLPFAETAKRARGGVEGTAALRCCRGLRGSTLKKRVQDWRPFRRWLLAEGHGCFPNDHSQVLDYFDVQWEAAAPRTFYQAFLDALNFLEQAGERPENQRLALHQGVRNAVKAFTAKRAQAKTQAEREAPKATKQAPPLLLAQVHGLEATVLDANLPDYHRFYAWAKLLRHWSSLRWDDSAGVRPQSLTLRKRGLAGTLERSKTSGPDKDTKILPIFVSKEAWVGHSHWLEAGLTLLDGELGFPRDYLVPLPNRDLSGSCGLKAQYSDALGLTRELLARLPQPEEPLRPLLDPTATLFWSEHSDRAGCSGWLASLGVPSDQRGFLGRWAVASTADHYVRVATRVVENLQVLAAKAARRSFRGGPDYFGEETVLEDLRRFLLTKGWTNAQAQEQLKLLERANPELPIPHEPRVALLDAHDEHDEPSDDWVHEGEANLHESEPDAHEGEPATEPEADHFLDDCPYEEVPWKGGVAAQEKANTAAPPEGFVIAITKSKVRRLHFVGNCGKVPGEHYKEYDAWGTLLPPEHEIDAVCSVCFRGDKGNLLTKSLGPDDAQDLVGTSSSSSSSSSSASASDSDRVISPKKKAKGGTAPQGA